MQSFNPSMLVPRLLAVAVMAATGSPAFAHHSASAFDIGNEMTITGTVSKYSFRNPHIYMEVDRQLENGSMITTEIEAGAASVIGPLGFTRDSVKVGDVVNVVGNPGRKDPQGLFLGRELYKQDGTYYPLNISSRPVTEQTDDVATSIEGSWFPPRNGFFGFLGSAQSWSVTEAGKAAIVLNGQTPTPQKDCLPLGEPALQFYPVVNVIEVFDDRVEMHIDWLESERTIWLDGRAHPPASDTFLHGHSVGHWEGKALVVDAGNFAPNPIGFSMGLPSGSGKHLVERFEVSADGKQLVYSGTMEDPQYLTEPATWTGNWEYRPDMQVSNEKCDIETAHRFLDD